jgi:hypothetical protein
MYESRGRLARCYNKYGDSVYSKPRVNNSSLGPAAPSNMLRGFTQSVLVNCEVVTLKGSGCNLAHSLQLTTRSSSSYHSVCKKTFIHRQVCVCVCVCVCARARALALRTIRNVQSYGLTCTHQGHPIMEMLQGKTELSCILPPGFFRWPDVLLDVFNQ